MYFQTVPKNVFLFSIGEETVTWTNSKYSVPVLFYWTDNSLAYTNIRFHNVSMILSPPLVETTWHLLKDA